MNYGSICSGIEAATAAWHPLGWKASFFSEIEAFPCAVLSHHYPNVPLHGDFTTIQDGDYEPIRLLVGGTPCQSFSIAGLRGGMADERGNLALEFCRLAQRLRPAWVVWENVPGVLSSNDGRDFGSILGALAELGYGLAYRILDAQYFGVPQRRRRVFVVGYFGDWRCAAAVLFDRNSVPGNSPPSRKTREETAGGVREGVAGSLGARHTGGWPGSGTDGHGAFIPELSHTLSDTTKGGANDMNRLGALISAPVTSKWSKGSGGPSGDECQNLVAFSSKDYGNDVSDISPTLRSMNFDKSHANGGGQVAIARSLRATAHSSHREDSDNFVSQSRSTVRRLTPRECERLQGFADDYTLVPFRGKPAADGPRYKAIGNSMAVPCMFWLGRRIQDVEDIINGTKH